MQRLSAYFNKNNAIYDITLSSSSLIDSANAIAFATLADLFWLTVRFALPSAITSYVVNLAPQPIHFLRRRLPVVVIRLSITLVSPSHFEHG